jgi:hypothetical protein
MSKRKRIEKKEKASLMDLSRLMDGLQFFTKYEELCSAALVYRDKFVKKLFQKIAGKDGDISVVMDRWYNKSDFFKIYRKARDEKQRGLL